MFGRAKNETEYGIRFGRKETWGYGSKSEAERAARRMNKAVKGGEARAKIIQRTRKKKDGAPVPTKCKGGKCKNGYTCVAHAKRIKGSEFELYDGKGRNKNTKRWDE